MTKTIPTASFGFSLLNKEIASKPNENVLISPVSISIALGMTANGARGTTLAGLIQGLALGGKTDSFADHNTGYKGLLDALKGSKLGVKLSIANAIFAREGIDFKPDFLTTCWNNYKATVDVVDFLDPETLETINNWCAGKTNERITKILEEIDPNGVMYLLNAVYFKGQWTDKFDVNKTDDDNFQTPGGTKMHPMMFRKAVMKYRNTGDYQVVALPFGEAKKVYLYVFLPAEGKTPADLVATFKTEDKFGVVNSLYESEGVLCLPRFEIEYGNQLNESLSALGMEHAFSRDEADFSGMADLAGLHITDVQHKTFASFDEEGGEAAAVTSVGMGLECARMSWKMNVNRPFLAVLGEESTGSVLFAGVVYNP